MQTARGRDADWLQCAGRRALDGAGSAGLDCPRGQGHGLRLSGVHRPHRAFRALRREPYRFWFRRIDHGRDADHDEAVSTTRFWRGPDEPDVTSVYRCRVCKRRIRGVRVMRRLGRLGVWYPVDRLDGAGIRHLLRTVEELGYSTLWYPEALGYESLSIASFMLANTTRLIIGSSIANIYARDPFTARRGLRTLSGLYDDRFILGLGVSHVPLVEGLRGHVYDKPVPAMRRYLDGVYEDPSNAAEWPLVIAALGPLMLKLAAERTAGAVPYNVTPEHTRAARAALGPDKLLAVEQKVCLQTTRRRRAASPGE